MTSRLLLVDGSSYLYRAFYALPDLRSPEGIPTGAIHGVVAMLKKLRNDFPSTHAACVFDAPGKTFRDDIYDQYKANRPSMPDDLRAQIDWIHLFTRALGWPLLSIPGIEADDAIGTLAKRYTGQSDRSCLISTGDKDLAQLVNSQIHLINTMSNELLDEAAVVAKFGVPPNRIVDYLSLVGDTVDNVPGVEKCGPKTAVKWLAQFDSLDGVIAHASEISGVVGKNLQSALAWLPTARNLVTVRCDCDLAGADEIEALHFIEADEALLKNYYRELGFKTWLRELGESLPDKTPKARSSSVQSAVPSATNATNETNEFTHSNTSAYVCIDTWPAFDALLTELDAAQLSNMVVAFDTETTGLDTRTAQLVGMSFCLQPGVAYYIPLQHRDLTSPTQLPLDQVLARLNAWLTSEQAKKVGQNLRYDAHVLANHGITLEGISEDTQLQSYILASDARHNMDDLAKRYLRIDTITYESLCGKGAAQISFADVPIAKAFLYAAEDADITLRLYHYFAQQLSTHAELNSVYRSIEMPLIPVLLRMERTGVLIDKNLLVQQSHSLGQKMNALEIEAHGLAGQAFNLNSPKQLAEILFVQQGLPIEKKTAGGAPSTDEAVLEKLAQNYPLARCILDYRSVAKLKSTYTDKLPRDIDPHSGRVHTHYAQTVAVTGRLASNDPNLQNIPIRTAEGRQIRAAFIAPEGAQIMSADYSQIELRIMAHLSGDTQLVKAFNEGRDIHQATAAEIFQVALPEVSTDQRRTAKMINFGLIYGMSAFGLAANLGIERSAAAHYINQYFTRYPGVAAYMERMRLLARAQGYVETIFGRRLWLRDIASSNVGRRQGAERAAINAPMQGSAADLIKLAMIATDDWLRTEQVRSRLIMQVHDELVLEVPDAEVELMREQIPRLMAQVAQLSVPLLAQVGVGPNWDQAH